MKRFFLLYFFFFLFSSGFSFSQTPVKIMDGEVNYLFNARLSEKELLDLRNGEVVCNSIKKLKFSRINAIPETQAMLDMVNTVNPNHLAEIIKILPYESYENLTEIVSQMLKNEESYTKVPFSIDDDGEVRYLYTVAKIESIRTVDEKEEIIERFKMPPLDEFTGKIDSEKLGAYFLYKMENTSKIKYRGFITAVGKKKMIAVISIFRYGDNWIIYALGGVDLIWLPFIGNTVDRAFYNRIKKFCLFTFEKLEESGSKDEEN